LEEARARIPADSPEAGRVARGIAELHLGPLENPRAAMPELARVAEILGGSTSGEWARRELGELKSRLAGGELDRLEARTPPRPPRDVLRELDLLLRTRYGLIHLQTDDEDRAESLLRHAADRRALPVVIWTPSRGMIPAGSDEPVYDTREPHKALRRIELGDHDALYHLRALPRYLERDEPILSRHLADAARAVAEGEGAIVTTGPDLRISGPLRGLAAVLRLPEPGDADYRTLLARVLHDVEARMDVDVAMTLPEQDRLVASLRGLALVEAERLLTRAIIEDGRLAARDIETVIDAKRRTVEREGALEYYPTETEWTEVADLDGLKEWLEKRRAVIREPSRAVEFGLPFPKGILLLGVPGCGKSLCARAVAMDWGLPLLALDPSNLYDKHLGE
ncbi:MAG: AAA family ATPase, partial [Gemmatimonadetes bacterium]|nr:AAA family ATPase [Gemmatimonadota bacterium]NIR77205.1 AAA family ATPase [Gemmatimonadota bacterium]NIT85722.1 AAA family ATPase [Gemmatimonadota bacterium]NIU34597.1 AAA family ATPase [Gemmatimonadota bacterium]NIV81528.1 AAA family ATPase [Gemmatimonadota bacterium]